MWGDNGAVASDEARYRAWSAHFFVRRMVVLIGIGILAYATFVVRDYFAYRDSFGAQIPFYVMGFASLGLTLGVISSLPHRWLPAVLPLSVWGMGFIPHLIWALFSSRPLPVPNLNGWMIIMLSAAVLVPLFWKAHAVAYAGLLLYLALYLITNPSAMPGLVEQSFYVIWTAIVCGLAVFFYERLQRTELFQRWQLEKANRRLQELDRVKSDFFANVSHELRTPLTLILGTFRRLAAGVSSDQARELVASGLRNTARLLVLIQEFLDLARLDSGRAKPVKRTVDVAQLVRQVASNFESSGPEKRITLTGVQVPLLAELDLYQMRKVLYNLLSNAFKFNDPETAHVWVRLRATPEHVVIEVEDNGFGIPEEELPTIFDRFARAKSTGQRREGTGIGLALAKEIVEAHGGTIEVRSAVGQGTTFTITLPRGHYDPDAVVGLDEDESGELIEFIYRQEVQRTLSSSPADGSPQPTATADEHAPLLLVADDNPDMRAYLRHLLAPHYRLVEAEDGQQALELARTHRPEIIVTDVMMPHMTGHELLRAIRADEDLARTPVIFLTARAGNEARVEALEAGADDYLSKPFDENELLARVRNLLRARAQERELAELNRRLEAKISEQMAELIRTGELKRFLSPSVVEHVLSGVHHQQGPVQRRDVTILFVDIVGFTTLTSHLDADTLIELLNTYLREMTAIAVAHRGTVDKFIGDALMVLFGAPHAMPPEEQARNAVRAALAMRQEAIRLADEWVAHGVLRSRFDVHMGLDTGPCAVGLFGSELQRSYTAIGTPVNVAARLQYQAVRGEILCTQRVYELAAGTVKATPLGPMTLEGIVEPVEVVRIEGIVPADGDERVERQATRAEESSG